MGEQETLNGSARNKEQKLVGGAEETGGRAEGVHRAGQPLPCVAVGRVVRKLTDQGVLRSRRRRMTMSWKSGQEGPGTETGGPGQVNEESRAREQDSQEELCPEEPQSLIACGRDC